MYPVSEPVISPAVLERQFYGAGFFLVEPAPRSQFPTRALLPEFVISISSHICDLHPSFGSLSWVDGSGFVIDNCEGNLNLSNEELIKAVEYTNKLFNEAQFGFDQIFCEKEGAELFHQIFLHKVSNVKLFQVFILAELSNTLIDQMDNNFRSPYGIVISLKRKNLVFMKDSDLIGYEIICHDLGNFHSFLCNSLEKAFLEKLDIHLNRRGLISSLEDAIRASNFCNTEESGAEPGYWLPCGLLEIPLQKAEVTADA